MGFAGFKGRMLARERLVGTFLRTPAPEIVEILAGSGLDFACFDAEHAPFDQARLDACMAVARALDFPAMVRVVSEDPAHILQALDAGAVGIVVPHVWDADKARRIAKAAHYGPGGRGVHGGTRWAGYRGKSLAELIDQSARETVVLAQIEEPEGVEAANDIAAVHGIDGLFIGPSDLSIGYGKTDIDSEEVVAAFEAVGAATRKQGIGFVTYVSGPEKAKEWQRFGLTVLFVASEQDWIASRAEEVVAALKDAPG